MGEVVSHLALSVRGGADEVGERKKERNVVVLATVGEVVWHNPRLCTNGK